MISKIPKWILAGSILLAFCAGFINGVVLFGNDQYAVSHITGTLSLFAHSLSSLELNKLIQSLCIILFFFFGATLSGLIIQGRSLYFGRRYGVALLVESACLFVSILLHVIKLPFLSVILISFSSGLQNALVTTYSNSIIRTTHLTGLLTDLGAALGCFLSAKKINHVQVRLHSSIFFSFLLGAFFSGLLSKYYGFLSILFPTIVIFLSGVLYTYISIEYRKHPERHTITHTSTNTI
ncbi:MAG: hypothetical protein A2015_12575 [Spirochaetes bacterium GWF1_31_7]|nr:MAG: hypothetical protein A2Y30_12435 [Spirochaetes bacterium GWE1_32_154]OHD44824.1 MAG: hypothetical protein A2Y29_03440 [Spirochaetes bacterium GWE2_31_10]OHD49615.1 MAG: hypothetical protein A2015_12575 [Spirochaetes bacterium GWF1_31_7]OHD81213.1 MAG: hypothetical protein A2355_09385 [Spirochaetes bacterium RIFOXYB1_FULL_32_8]